MSGNGERDKISIILDLQKAFMLLEFRLTGVSLYGLKTEGEKEEGRRAFQSSLQELFQEAVELGLTDEVREELVGLSTLKDNTDEDEDEVKRIAGEMLKEWSKLAKRENEGWKLHDGESEAPDSRGRESSGPKLV